MRTSSLIVTILAGSLIAGIPAASAANPCETDDQPTCESAKLYGESTCSWVDASTYERDGETVERSGYCRARPLVGVVETLRAKGVLDASDMQSGAE